MRHLIDIALDRTAATVVCIGEHSAARAHVDYEIEKSIERGNVVIGVRIHQIPDQRLDVTVPGEVPWRLKEMGIPIVTFTTADDLGRTIAMRRVLSAG